MNERRAFELLTLGALGAAGVLSVSDAAIFRPYFGDIPPLVAVLLAALLGVTSLGWLRSHGFEVFSLAKWPGGLARAALCAAPFAAAAILADVAIGFPKSLNVPLPAALLFYPVMAYVVETAVHGFLLVVLLFVLGRLFTDTRREGLVWMCAVLAAIPEPVFQVASAARERPFELLDGYVGLHVFAFNLVELYLFRRYDFVSMLSFRLVYYFYWHIGWGTLRLYW